VWPILMLDGWKTCFLTGRFWIKILTRSPAVFAGNVPGLPLTFQTNAGLKYHS